MTPSRAIDRVARIPPEDQVSDGLIVELLRPLDHAPAFPGIAGLVESTADESAFLSDLTETFARVYLANVEETGHVIGFVHSVLASAARSLVCCLSCRVVLLRDSAIVAAPAPAPNGLSLRVV